MLQLSPEMKAKYGLELATKRHEHADLDAAVSALMQTGRGDPMTMQRLKKKKLAIKDRIVQLERILLPDIIA
jgi:hypothetical protein